MHGCIWKAIGEYNRPAPSTEPLKKKHERSFNTFLEEDASLAGYPQQSLNHLPVLI